MILASGTTLAPVPPHKFSRLKEADFSAYEFEALGHVCAFTGLQPEKVTRTIADALLTLTYNLPQKHRSSPVQILFLILLSHQALTMFLRCEIEQLAACDQQFADDALRVICGDPTADSLDVQRGLLGALSQVRQLVGSAE